MIDRRGFLKAIFGLSVGAVTKGARHVAEAMTTRKVAKQALKFVTASEICSVKMFYLPYVPLLMPVNVKETMYGEGRLDES